MGFDSFGVHALANSISIFGEAKWRIHPLSIVGMYPYSVVSSVPFILSGISQCTGIDVELVIRLYETIIGIFSIFTAYLLAGMLKDDDLFKFLVAFCFSVSPGVLTFSTWDASTRGFFLILLPLFVYLLLKTRIFKVRYSLLAITLFMMLLATHHYIYFTIPIIFSFFIIILMEKFVRSEEIRSNNFVNFGYLTLFFIFFMYPFLTYTFIGGSRYGGLWTILMTNVRYSGILVVFAVGGFTYLTFKYNKDIKEWFLLFILLFFAPLSYITIYAHYFAVIFILMLVCIALTNVAKAPQEQKRKYVVLIIVISLLLSISFSGFYQHWRTHMGGGHSAWYMRETTYAGALWIKDNINENKNMVCNGGWLNLRPQRMHAASGGRPAILVGRASALIDGFINESYIEMKKNSPLSTEFYMDNPYVEVAGRSIVGRLNWFSECPAIDKGSGKRAVDEFDLSYMIEDTDIHDPIMRSVREKKNNVYDNGEICIWTLF
jgi:hypothetical protein